MYRNLHIQLCSIKSSGTLVILASVVWGTREQRLSNTALMLNKRSNGRLVRGRVRKKERTNNEIMKKSARSFLDRYTKDKEVKFL